MEGIELENHSATPNKSIYSGKHLMNAKTIRWNDDEGLDIRKC